MNEKLTSIAIAADGNRTAQQAVSVLREIRRMQKKKEEEILNAMLLPLYQSEYVDTVQKISLGPDGEELFERSLGECCEFAGRMIQDTYGGIPLNLMPSTLDKLIELGEKTYGTCIYESDYKEVLGTLIQTNDMGIVVESSQNVTHMTKVDAGLLHFVIDVTGHFGQDIRLTFFLPPWKVYLLQQNKHGCNI